jgi:hypothetical protein
VIIRATIANQDPLHVARLAQAKGLSGTILQSVGFGAWGVEPGVILESATDSPALLLSFVASLCQSTGEQCAYVTVNGADAFLLYADGHQERAA